jgi:putative NADPH-quinone reductase
MIEKKALLLVGSPRGIDRSSSGRLGGRLLDALKERGFETDKLHVHAAVDSRTETEQALIAIGAADVVVLSLPLYVDSFPAPVIALFERIVEQRTGVGSAGTDSAGSGPAATGRVRLLLLIQCGFPERTQNATALAIAERFAAEAGWEWLGGLAFGAMENYSGSATEVLPRIAGAIADGKPIPEVTLKRVMPAWFYRLGGNIMWRRQAKKNGVARRLRAKPYAN